MALIIVDLGFSKCLATLIKMQFCKTDWSGRLIKIHWKHWFKGSCDPHLLLLGGACLFSSRDNPLNWYFQCIFIGVSKMLHVTLFIPSYPISARIQKKTTQKVPLIMLKKSYHHYNSLLHTSVNNMAYNAQKAQTEAKGAH